MTGQGDHRMDQIKAARIGATTINLHKTYRTVSGHRVRALTVITTRNKMINGKAVELAHSRNMIKGQVFMRDMLDNDHFNWIDQVWEEDGTHLLSELNLVEFEEKVQPQPMLF